MIENYNSLLIQTVELFSKGEIHNNISFNQTINCKYRVNSIVTCKQCTLYTARDRNHTHLVIVHTYSVVATCMWGHIQVSFRPWQEIEPKVGVGRCSIVGQG